MEEGNNSDEVVSDRDKKAELEVSEKANKVKEDWSFVGESGQHDLTLLVEEHKVPVSKAILCVASPVFRAMLESSFVEKHMHEVELPGKNYEDFAEFLRCIYPDKLKSISEDNVYQVLPMVMEYQVKILQERCQTLLVKIVKNKPGDVVKHIGLAELYNMEDLRQICVYIASEDPLNCIEQTEVVISTKSLLQIHLLYIKRNNLNKLDDERLHKECSKDIYARDVNVSDYDRNHNRIIKTINYHEIIRDYIEKKTIYMDSILCTVRLSYRYGYALKQSKINEISYCTSSEISTETKEGLSLLPEHIKTTLNFSEDKKKFLYPPLPAIPMLEGN